MARSLRDLRRKMRAIQSTRQVTKAMELVSASKMRRAVSSAQMLRRYALTAWNILENLAYVHPTLHPYLEEKPASRILAVLFTSDRGLCGSLNAQMLRTTRRFLEAERALPSCERVDFIAVGARGQQYLARTGQSIAAAFPALSNHPTFRDVLPIVKMATEGFLSKTYDHIVLLYPDFKTILLQLPTVKVLLPFSKTELKSMLESLMQRKTEGLQAASYPSDRVIRAGKLQVVQEFLFEPSATAILQTILPQLTELQVYQAVLEAAASEHSARMVAMQSATDNASDLLDDLTLTYNQTRQANITAELSELSAAKAALD